MTSRISKRFGTVSRMAAVVLAGVLVLGAGLKATAQDADASTLHGTWRVQVTPYDCTTGQKAPTFSSMFSFHRGGTFGGNTSTTAFQPGQITSHLGSWSHIRRNSYQVVSEAFILFTSNPGPGPVFQQGTQRITQAITLHGDQFTSIASAQFFDVWQPVVHQLRHLGRPALQLTILMDSYRVPLDKSEGSVKGH